MRTKRRKSDWAEDIKALAVLYLRDVDVRALVDRVAANPEVCWPWDSREFPQRALAAAGDLGELLLEQDRIVFDRGRRFQPLVYTYYPSPFLVDYCSELLTAVRWAQAKGVR